MIILLFLLYSVVVHYKMSHLSLADHKWTFGSTAKKWYLWYLKLMYNWQHSSYFSSQSQSESQSESHDDVCKWRQVQKLKNSKPFGWGKCRLTCHSDKKVVAACLTNFKEFSTTNKVNAKFYMIFCVCVCVCLNFENFVLLFMIRSTHCLLGTSVIYRFQLEHAVFWDNC